MRTRFALPAALALVAAPALAHHGWGSYDAAHPVTVTGPILTSKFENPHVTVTVRGSDKVWTLTLAPTSRMESRGASAELVAVGKVVKLGKLPVKFQLAGQYMVIHPDNVGQEWNIQFVVTPIIPKLIKEPLFK